MKKAIYMFASLALIVIASACNGSKSQSAAAEETSDALTVDELLTNPENYVEKTVTFEGICSHLCKHGGRKAFVQGNADNMMLRCEAFPGMNEPFSGETIHHPIRVTGIFHEERIDEAYLKELERIELDRVNYINQNGGESATPGEQESGCDTERAAHGQQNLNTLNERIADYRARIAERQAKEGKDYLSFYYLEATGYEILPD